MVFGQSVVHTIFVTSNKDYAEFMKSAFAQDLADESKFHTATEVADALERCWSSYSWNSVLARRKAERYIAAIRRKPSAKAALRAIQGREEER